MGGVAGGEEACEAFWSDWRWSLLFARSCVGRRRGGEELGRGLLEREWRGAGRRHGGVGGDELLYMYIQGNGGQCRCYSQTRSTQSRTQDYDMGRKDAVDIAAA